MEGVMITAYVVVALGLPKGCDNNTYPMKDAAIHLEVIFKASKAEAYQEMAQTCAREFPEREWPIDLMFSQTMLDGLAAILYEHARSVGTKDRGISRAYLVAAIGVPKAGPLSPDGYAYTVNIQCVVDLSPPRARRTVLAMVKKEDPDYRYSERSMKVKEIDDVLALKMVTYAIPE